MDVLPRKGEALRALDYMDDGTPIAVAVTIDAQTGTAVFNFTGTGPQVLGNVNAPRAVRDDGDDCDDSDDGGVTDNRPFHSFIHSFIFPQGHDISGHLLAPLPRQRRHTAESGLLGRYVCVCVVCACEQQQH